MVEIIPKESAKLPSWLNALFFAFLVILFLSVLSFFILDNSLKKSGGYFQGLTVSLNELKSLERSASEREVLKYNSKIEAFFKLLDQHIRSSKIFDLIQASSHPQVWFSQFNLNAEGNKVILSGKTPSFEILGQQILIFKERNWIEKVELQKISISKERNVDFELSVYIKPGILR